MEDEKPVVHAPTVFVRGGGTPTTKSEQYHDQLYRDAEKRRDEHDAERAVAREHGGGKTPGVATGLHDVPLTRHPEVPKAYVLLSYLTRGGEDTGLRCLADVIVGENTDRPTELTLMVVCPKCAAGQKHLQDCQLRISQSRKHFKLVPGKGDPMFEFEGSVFKSAGVIVESEKCRCPDCGYTFRIDQNRVWPD